MQSLGLIVLAAGGSSRLGQPKQLLPFGDTSLIRHACQCALGTPHRPLVVVLGAHEESCRRELAGLSLTMASNSQWETGLASSLALGLQTLEEIAPAVSGALILLHDQPLVTPTMLEQLVRLWDPPKILISAASYGDRAGVPAVFARSLFAQLRALRGDEGARKIILQYREQTAVLTLPDSLDDIDTPEDYQRMLRALPSDPAA